MTLPDDHPLRTRPTFEDDDYSDENEPQYCEYDNCWANMCGGPHYEVATSIGIEILREDQDPIGEVIRD